MKIYELIFNEKDTDKIFDNTSPHGFEMLLNHYENIIQKLIFNNMTQSRAHPWDMYLNFSVYIMTFNGTSTSSLKDCTDYFTQEINKIMPFKDKEN